MRLLLKLESLSNQKYNNEYQYALQSYFYSLLRDTEYTDLHDETNIKFFNFSNIFPINDYSISDNKYILLSSPDYVLMNIFKQKLEQEKNNKIINIYTMKFLLREVKELNIIIKPGDTIYTETPIILKYNENDKTMWWGSKEAGQNLSKFIYYLEQNLIKKYSYFYFMNKNISDSGMFSLQKHFQKIEFKRTACLPVSIKGNTEYNVGSLWRFEISKNINRHTLRFLQFCFDAGFGQKTAMGFGFLNNDKPNKKKIKIIKKVYNTV